MSRSKSHRFRPHLGRPWSPTTIESQSLPSYSFHRYPTSFNYCRIQLHGMHGYGDLSFQIWGLSGFFLLSLGHLEALCKLSLTDLTAGRSHKSFHESLKNPAPKVDLIIMSKFVCGHRMRYSVSEEIWQDNSFQYRVFDISLAYWSHLIKSLNNLKVYSKVVYNHYNSYRGRSIERMGKHKQTQCPIEGCSYKGRSNNMIRHLKSHERATLKHAPSINKPKPERLKFKKGRRP